MSLKLFSKSKKPKTPIQINQRGLNIIKKWEGLKLEAYRCPVGIWTIGYGHTGNVEPGQVISEHLAEQLLRQDCYDAERAVEEALENVPYNDNEFSAFVSLTFNIGGGAFAKSTTLKRFRAGDLQGAAQALKWWNKGRINGVLETLPGLVSRREDEAKLLLWEPEYDDH